VQTTAAYRPTHGASLLTWPESQQPPCTGQMNLVNSHNDFIMMTASQTLSHVL